MKLADLTLTGATVFTGTEVLNDAWVSVSDGKISGLGRDNPPAATRTIDARGTTILPGLTDAHAHLYGLGMALDTVSLVETKSPEDAVARVRERAGRAAAGEWILGRGWDQNDWPVKEFPTAAMLDAVTTRQPVWLRRIDGHAGWANQTAMELAGINAATPDPSGGRIIRDSRGNPSGVFIDDAMNLIDNIIPPPSPEVRKRRVQNAAENIAAHGLTEIHDAGAEAETLSAVRDLIDEGRFPIRVYAMLDDNASLLNFWFTKGPLLDYGGKLTVRSVKLYADGALGSRGAALLAPYSDDSGNRGLLRTTEDHVADVSERAKRAGFQVNTHAIGDGGNRLALDAYERAGVTAGDRFRIEHLQVIALDDIPRLARSGIIASMQPTHATSDMYWAEQRVGPERIRGAYAWRKVLNAGARLALGSDFPVEEVNPMHGIYAAVTRQDQKGWPSGGWYPEEKVTLAEAIRGFTADAAYAAFEEDSRGTIEVGKLGDLTVLEGDLFTTASSELFKQKVRYTIVGGKVVFSGHN